MLKYSRSCWVIIQNKVYDVTEFLPDHPGGAEIILRYAGRDATSVYEPIHPQDALEKNLPLSKHLGPLTDKAIQAVAQGQQVVHKLDALRIEHARKKMPPLNRILNLKDMQDVAKQILSSKAFAFYYSASDDEITNRENARAFSRFFFRPRVMRPVSHCDPSTTILGFKSSIPVFVSGAALAKLGHPQGELNITRGSAKEGIIQMVSFNASFSPREIMEVADNTQTLFFQLYKNRSDEIAEQRVREVEKLGYKAIFLTVDAIVTGNRERDIRCPWILEDEENGGPTEFHVEDTTPSKPTNILGTAGTLTPNKDIDMTWETTIPWLRKISKLPIIIKGIQCVEDAVLAAEAGVEGILLSNHGGRQLSYSLPPIEVLHDIRLQRPDIFTKLEVYIDGGVQRGTDVVKAVCLGAKAVGLGRPFLYAQSLWCWGSFEDC